MAERCAECGFDYDGLAPEDAVAALEGLGRRYRAPLTRFLPGEDGSAVVRAHSVEGTWSALEYACHVRDVLAVQRERIELALREHEPMLEPMRREERVVEMRYNEQDPVEVADELASNAAALAELAASLGDDGRARTCVYHDQGVRTLEWVVVHTVHEGEHHLLDMGRVLRAARGR